MEVRVLRYFLVIVREQNLSKAAAFLHTTQPNLTRQIQNLEQEIGKKLFLRTHQRMLLTEAGVLLRKRAEEIVALCDKAEAELLSNDQEMEEDIYIGSGETFAIKTIAEVMKSIQSECTKVRLHLYSGDTMDVLERLDKGLIDFGVLIEPADIRNYNSLRLPFKDQWGILMHKDATLAKKKVIEASDVWNVPLICSKHMLQNNTLSQWLSKDFEEVNLVATYTLLYNASLLVEQLMGYALCLDHLINVTGDSVLCFRPLEPKVESQIVIVWKRHQVFSPASAYFLECLKKRIQT